MLNTFIQENNIQADNSFFKFMEKYIPKKMELTEDELKGFIEEFINALKTLVPIKEIKVENKKNIIVIGEKDNEEYVYTFKTYFDKKQIKVTRLEIGDGVCVFNQKPSGEVERVFFNKDNSDTEFNDYVAYLKNLKREVKQFQKEVKKYTKQVNHLNNEGDSNE